ncbi:surfeit locus protein 2 [Gastrophryne carolinensis]
MEEQPEELRGFLLQHPSLQPIPGNKVRFTPTGHELPCRLPDLQSFITGRKYQRLSRLTDYSQYEPHIVPSTKNGKQLFCKLTIRHIKKCPEEVQRHIAGKRYQRALRKYEECQKLGVEFVPACLQNKSRPKRSGEERKDNGKKDDLWEPDDSGSEEVDSDDSMSDLYPAHMFTKKSTSVKDNGRLQPDSEEMEVEESTSNGPGKRVQHQTGPARKKFKSQQKKSRKFQKSAKK